VAWASAVLPFVFALFWRQHREQLTPESLCERRHILWLTAMLPVTLAAAAVLFAVTMYSRRRQHPWADRGGRVADALALGLAQPDVTWAPGKF